MIRATVSLSLVLVLLGSLGCDASPAERIDAGRAGSDASSAEDAGSLYDAGRPVLGPVVAGAALDGIDRARDPACPASARWAVGVVGRVLDPRGTPRSGVLGQSCLLVEGGRSVCLAPEPTDERGVFTIVLGESLRCIREVALRVVEPHALVSTAYATAPAQPDDGVVFATEDIVVYDLAPATSLPAIGDAAQSRTVAFTGAELTVAPEMLDEGVYASLSARVLRDGEAASADFLGAGESFAFLATFGPESRIDGAVPAPFRLVETGLRAGTPVVIFALSGLYTRLPDGTMPREGQWHRLGEATVGEGGVIATPPGVGLTELGWVGVTLGR